MAFQYGVLQVMISIFLKLISFRREKLALVFSRRPHMQQDLGGRVLVVGQYLVLR